MLFPTPLVSTTWLFENLDDPTLIVLDASSSTNKAALEAAKKQLPIPSARPFNIAKDFSDQESPYPNMLADPEQFTTQCQKLGINSNSKVVVYDNLGIYTSPRAWWMLRVMGLEQVAVLDGGLPAWIAQGYPTEVMQNRSYSQGDFVASFKAEQCKDIAFMQANLSQSSCIVVDARSAGRFVGTTPEPRAGLRGGHIPGSFSIPYTDLLKDGHYKSVAELRAIFAQLPSTNQPLVFSCGSGITACVVLLASTLVQDTATAVYDGSWTEWAQVVKA